MNLRKLIALSGLVILMAFTATSTAQAIGTSTSTNTTVTQNKQIIRYWFPNNSIAYGTACRESGFDERAINYNGGSGYIDRGLFQIDSIHNGTHVHYYTSTHGVDIVIDPNKLFIARYNARVAWAMSRGGTSWGPWNGGTTYCTR